MKTKFFRKLMFVCALVGLVSVVFAKKPIKTLIITGQNNHNWQVSHVVLKQILENSGRFVVDYAISPAQGKDMSSFLIDFTPYGLVVLDYNGDAWPEETNKRFLSYVQNGGGVVVYHAADNAFSQWKEFNEICALGGWEGRNEKSGPWVYWVDGKLIKDSSPGVGGSHGQQHEYVLTARTSEHPIMKGLPHEWKHAKDELYDRMRGPGNIKDLLYTAYSDKATGGSGREEPLIFTVDYGKARIFHTMLGHAGPTVEDSPSMQCAGFQITLLRGAEWAATGKVTQKVPKDMMLKDKSVSLPQYK
ncbi:ThuA domain-containing protein [Parabacteroides pacaensis]|uniref:ThuA domain-containing protein n=1 Tax=Parabacteroides pacaensis TaxID=2086575 RepID=UPI000D101730|nr:ThuA domain-containing protein [Parabacteroides pacaensis]